MNKDIVTKIRSYSPILNFCKWNIGIANVPIEEYFKRKGEVPIKWLEPQKGGGNFNADPFGLYLDGQYYIFVENLDFKSYKGKISVTTAHKEKRDIIADSNYRTALELPNHLSYPHVFTHRDKIYMIPENGASNNISLYVATDFPYKWEKVKTLVSNFPGVDSTIFHYNDLWWLFSTKNGKNVNSELHIWYSKDIFEEWIEHSCNPVKKDIKCTRPGGTPFVSEGILYRPAQNSLKRYGHQLAINKIVELSPDKFEEEVVLELPGYKPYQYTFHTLSSCGDITLIDGSKLESPLKLLYPYLKMKLRRRIKKW